MTARSPTGGRRAGLLALAVLALATGRAAASPYDPHFPSLYDPNFRAWWEGWEVRLLPIDEEAEGGGGASAPAEATSPHPPASAAGPRLLAASLALGQSPRGMLAWNITLVRSVLSWSEDATGGGRDADAPRSGRPAVYESTSEQLSVRFAGEPVVQDPPEDTPVDFSIASEPGASWSLTMRGDDCDARGVGGGGPVSLECVGPPTPWGPAPADSPEGSAASLPTSIIGQHWFVHSLSTRVEFRATLPATARGVDGWGGGEGRAEGVGGPGSAARGVASAFFSKHWGSAFSINGARMLAILPRRGDGSGDTVVAFEGGQLATPLVPAPVLPEGWFLGIRAGEGAPSAASFDLHTQDPAVFRVSADACAGRLTLSADQPYGSAGIEVEARADPSTFYEISGPSPSGIVAAVRSQSQAAVATVRVFEKGHWPWSERALLAQFEIPRAQLEFVGATMCGGGPTAAAAVAAA